MLMLFALMQHFCQPLVHSMAHRRLFSRECNFKRINFVSPLNLIYMKFGTYIRIFVLMVAITFSLMLYSYTRQNATTNSDCADKQRCEQQGRNQSATIFWESFSDNF
jgi:hypothetical protein